jgi:dTDP-glucose 4,6-dehydratase
MIKKVLILGTSSFGGSSLAKYLIDKKIKVIGTYNQKKNIFYQQHRFSKNKNFFKSYKINFLNERDITKLKKIINKEKPEYIIDFASICMVNESWDMPKYYFKVNCLSKVTILDFLKNKKFLKSYIYISTPEVFGSNNFSVKENCQIFNPSTPYAASKLFVEKLIKVYNSNFHIPFNICRFSNFYGIGQPNYRLIPKVICSIILKTKFPLQGNGKSLRNFIDAYDFSNGLFKVMQRGKNKQTYHFSSKKLYKVIDIIIEICSLYKIDHKKLIRSVTDRQGKDFKYNLNSNFTRQALRWDDKIDLSINLLKITNYYDMNKKSLLKLDLNYKKSIR